MTIASIMQMAPVIPVLVLDVAHDPAKLAATLVEAGLPVIEVTLRTICIGGDRGDDSGARRHHWCRHRA